MSDKRFFDDYDDKIEDVDEVTGTDVKINPDYYIHECLNSLTRCLTKEDTQSGFLQFRAVAEHLESLARSAGFLDDGYVSAINDFITANDLGKITNVADHMKVANEKVRLITERVFGSKVNTAPAKA